MPVGRAGEGAAAEAEAEAEAEGWRGWCCRIAERSAVPLLCMQMHPPGGGGGGLHARRTSLHL